MRIGIPKETKEGERRVGLTPAEVRVLVDAGHAVLVERGAGRGIGLEDDGYAAAGARVGDAWGTDLIVKVKEIQPADLAHLRADSVVFGFHHLVGEPEMTRALAARRTTAIAYEMVRDGEGRFPLLAPMSLIAGRMAVRVATDILGWPPAKVLVLGAGNAGLEAAKAARSVGAQVSVLARRASGDVGAATPEAIERHALEADLVVGAVFIAGTPTPKLLPRSLVARMKPGAVIVDISIDAGGVAETSRPTTHAQPTYVEAGVVHYCVTNMPAAHPRESAAALAAAALPFVRELADRGVARALGENAALRAGVMLWKGRVNHRGIAEESGLAYTPVSDADLHD
jgi:alanine dehydrogenase